MLVCIINNNVERKELPEAETVEAVGDTIDVLHDRGYHEYAHRLDDAMCRWCELLL